ncbi:hypothetical protein [Burkholderia metallica]|uniref:hypothetical protein n=1 Tax=Burkholderia metallica TaxID=488729 RepID=UPI00131C631E|nr:hypothetical protein [Burkholderia metallica]
MTNGTSKTGRRAGAAAVEWTKRGAGGTGVMTAALMVATPYLGSCAPDDSGTTRAPVSALPPASPMPASPGPAADAHDVAERIEPPAPVPAGEEAAPPPIAARPAFRAPPFAPVRRPAIAVWLDDRPLGGPFPAGLPADRPPLPNGPLPDERFDPFRPHRDGPILRYAGAAESLRSWTIDGERLARVAAPDLPPLPGVVGVQLAGAADSPFYADQVADALARHAAFGGVPLRNEADEVRTASADGGDASGAGPAGAPFYADQVAYAREPAMGAVAAAVPGGALPTDARMGSASVVSRALPSTSGAGSTRSLEVRRPAGPSISASLPELAAQVAGIGGQHQAPPALGARPERGEVFAAPAWRVAMRVSTGAVLGADPGERSRARGAVRTGKNGRASEGLPTIVADTRGAPPHESRATERQAAVSGLPSAVEIAAALVRPNASGRAPVASQKPSRTARGATHAIYAEHDTGWRAATMTTVGGERYGRFRRGDPIYDNIMAPVAAAQHRTIKVEMPSRRAYGDVATNVVLASSGPPLEADQKRTATIGLVF